MRTQTGEFVSVSALETIAVVNTSRISGFHVGLFPVLSPLPIFIVRAGLKCTKGKVFSFFNCVKECRVCKLTPRVRTQVVWGHPSGKYYCFESYTVLVNCRISKSWLHSWVKTAFVFRRCDIPHNVTHFTHSLHIPNMKNSLQAYRDLS
jgi:hypothetical protein